jgi:hypothetical protein
MAVFAFVWAVARARIQSVVGDEASTYLGYIHGATAQQWLPAASNHLLNTLLVQLFTSVFGVSELSLRAGALVGAAIYIVSAYWLCRMLSREWIVRLPLFACLVYNPYVFDFFVAARGYGLALAFMLTAIAVAAWSHLEQRRISGCGFASLCIGLSFAANFSFAFADAALLLMIFLWTALSGPTSDARQRWKLLTACAVPAVIVVLLIPSSALLNWPKGQLFWGADSMRATITSMIKATVDRMNPHLVNPSLLELASRQRRFLIPAFWGAALLQLGAVCFAWRRLRNAENTWRAGLMVVAGGTAGLAMLLHWIAFRAFGLPLPLDRTAVFFAPLLTLMAGATISIPLGWRMGVWIRRVAVSALCVMAAYFMSCLRLNYFHEWHYSAEVKDAYFVAAYFNHTRCAQKVYSSWYYESAMDFYRVVNPHDRFTSFIDVKYPTDRQLYVLNAVFDEDFIREQKLTMVYHGEATDIAVYLPRNMAMPPEKVCDAALLP